MSPKTYVVSSVDEFHATLKVADGGDTIALKPGIYEGINIRDVHFNSAVTITSSDPDDPAILQQKTSIRDSSNLTFDNLQMQHVDTGSGVANSAFKALFYVTGSSDITLQNSVVQGQDAEATDTSRGMYEGFPFGKGVRIADSKDVVITGNEITNLFSGIGLKGTENVTISNNHIHKMRVDGIAGTDQKNTLIEENLFENFTPYRVDPQNPSGYTDDHSDMIQYYGTNASFGIDGFAVRNNVFLQDKIGTQTIYGGLNNDDPNVVLQNFEISGNLIYNGHANGITVSSVTGVKIFDNTVLANEFVLEDFRHVPTVNIRYEGARATDDAFDLNSDEVQRARDIDVSNNVLSHAFQPQIVIRAYSKHANEREDVTDSLNISEQGNHWISTRLPSEDFYEYIFKLSYEPEEGKTTLSIDERSADLYGDAGSAYYTDPAALQALFAKLNTRVDLQVNTDLSAVELEDQSEGLGSVVQIDIDDYVTQADSEPLPPKQEEAPVSEAPAVEAPVVGEAPTVSEDPVDTPQGDQPSSIVLTHEGDDGDDLRLRSRDGDDVMAGYDGKDLLITGSGEDLAYGGAGDDRIYGKRGDDTLDGGSGNDFLRGGSGDDIIITGSGRDDIHGGGGYDIVVLEGAPAQYDIYLLDKTLRIEHRQTGEVDEARSVEAIYFQDVDALYAVNGRTGETSFLNSADYAEPYNTLREIAANADTSQMLETLSGEAADTDGTSHDADGNLHGTDERDILWGNSETQAVYGHEGDDILFGLNQLDVLIGGSGRDQLRGESGDDILVGGADNDKLFGQRGADLMLGGSGQDFISGGAGNDIVVGGLDNDRLWGGSGLDTVVLAGQYRDYVIEADAQTKTTTVMHKDTGEIDLLSNIEQLYFDQQDRLYELSHTGATSYMAASSNAESYALLKDSPWDAYADEMIY